MLYDHRVEKARFLRAFFAFAVLLGEIPYFRIDLNYIVPI